MLHMPLLKDVEDTQQHARIQKVLSEGSNFDNFVLHMPLLKDVEDTQQHARIQKVLSEGSNFDNFFLIW